MNSLRDIYKRFRQNYHTETGGINIYPQFDNDLKVILNWVEDNLVDSDEPIWDCTWSKPEEE